MNTSIVNFNVSTSKFTFITGIALSALTHVGWWAVASLVYYVLNEVKRPWVRIPGSILFLIAIGFAIARTGWTF